MKVPLANISAPFVDTLKNLEYSTTSREVAEDIVEKLNEYRKTFEVFISSIFDSLTSNSQKRKLEDDEMPSHAVNSSFVGASQGSSTDSAFEKHLCRTYPRRSKKQAMKVARQQLVFIFECFL